MVWAKDGRRGKAQETQPSEMGRLEYIRRIRARGPGRAGLRALPTIGRLCCQRPHRDHGGDKERVDRFGN